MEIIINTTDKREVFLGILHWYDLLHFYVHPTYLKEVKDVFPYHFLYVPIRTMQESGVHYWIFPIAWTKLLGRKLRMIWLWPVIKLHQKGLAYIPRGEIIGMLWFKYLGTRPKDRKKV